MNITMTKKITKQQGLSLVELMVAITLTLILTAAVIQVYLAQKQTSRFQMALADIQESGRFAMSFLAEELRMAGYLGCSNLNQITPNIIANSPTIDFSQLSDGLVGYRFDGSNWTPPPPSLPTGIDNGSDFLTLRKGEDCNAHLDGNMSSDNANVQISNAITSCSFDAGDLLMVTDCEDADLFKATTVSNSSGLITIAHANNLNSTNNLSKAYQSSAKVLKFSEQTFYIRNNAAGIPSLYRGSLQGDGSIIATELVPGVEAMGLLYGINSNPDLNNSADAYVSAENVNDWSEVVSIRLHLLVVSLNPVLNESQTYSFMGSTVTATDRFLRFEFTSTINLRNRTLGI